MAIDLDSLLFNSPYEVIRTKLNKHDTLLRGYSPYDSLQWLSQIQYDSSFLFMTSCVFTEAQPVSF